MDYDILEVQDQHSVFLRVQDGPVVRKRAGSARVQVRRIRIDYRSSNDSLYHASHVLVTGYHVTAAGIVNKQIESAEDFFSDELGKAPEWIRALVEERAPAWNDESVG